MTIEKLDAEARRHLSLDEKVDLILDRFLGNPLRGIVGQIDLISMLDRSVTDVKTSNAEMFHRMQRLEEVIQRQQTKFTDEQTDLAEQVQVHRREVDTRFQALYFWLSVVGVVVVALVIINLFILLKLGA